MTTCSLGSPKQVLKLTRLLWLIGHMDLFSILFSWPYFGFKARPSNEDSKLRQTGSPGESAEHSFPCPTAGHAQAAGAKATLQPTLRCWLAIWFSKLFMPPRLSSLSAEWAGRAYCSCRARTQRLCLSCVLTLSLIVQWVLRPLLSPLCCGLCPGLANDFFLLLGKSEGIVSCYCQWNKPYHPPKTKQKRSKEGKLIELRRNSWKHLFIYYKTTGPICYELLWRSLTRQDLGI